jgi:hypothetical protein
MTDPLDQITGLTSDIDDDDVGKADHRAYIVDDLHFFATCAAVRARDLSRRSRIMVGSRFFRKDTEDTSADDLTETTTTLIDNAGNHWLVIEGERYDIPFPTTGLLGDGEPLPAFGVVTPLMIPAGCPGSIGFAVDEVPTGEVIITFKKSLDYGVSWTNAFTLTIAAGERVGSFTLASDLSLPAYSLLRPYGPATHDPTMESFTATIAALR